MSAAKATSGGRSQALIPPCVQGGVPRSLDLSEGSCYVPAMMPALSTLRAFTDRSPASERKNLSTGLNFLNFRAGRG
jgi:hypothetical protein